MEINFSKQMDFNLDVSQVAQIIAFCENAGEYENVRVGAYKHEDGFKAVAAYEVNGDDSEFISYFDVTEEGDAVAFN